ncbi:MAG: ribonuclease HII [Tissierellia bacterium]|nr:ribonuclease HII [Tissierellia bacterium]
MKVKLKRGQVDKLTDYTKDHKLICGIDEVGRGPIAGPVVSCALIMPSDRRIDQVRDSKKLSDKKRRMLAKEIYDDALAVGFGVVDQELIDDINIRQATHLSMNLAIINLRDKNDQKVYPDLALIDAETIDNDIDQVSIIGGDDSVYEISCASILAKVYRDDMMIEYGKKYPSYGFENHKGYGTKAHYLAIDEVGICPIHRKTFLRKYYEKKQETSGHDGGRDSL